MQFIRGGPDIPNEIIEALEEDRLILFCGAGISMPTLPNFRGLVERVYQQLHEDIALDSAEANAFKNWQFDRVLDLLERRVGRKKVRDAVIIELTAPALAPTDRHSHIVELARAQDGSYRLVTTNFDDLFERATATLSPRVNIDEAPKLPVPLPHRWSSLVHLHGRIDPGLTLPDNNLIFTSADFGRAYLTEGWASRFVTELFAHFSVLFVGYAAEDPIIRYLLDALAAERTAAKPEDRPRKAYAFAGYKRGSSDLVRAEWRNKGVEAVTYRIRRGEDHSLLYETIEAWARWKREGLTGRLRHVEQAWRYRPLATPPYDHEIQKVLWALKDTMCAQRFAESPTAAPWEWRAVLEQNGMLSRPFRPSGDRQTPLVDYGNSTKSPLDEITSHLGRWLTRHLDKPEMLEWVLENGGVPHPEFRHQILQRMRLPELDSPSPLHCPPLAPMVRRAWEIVATTTDAIERRFQAATFHAVLQPDSSEHLVHAELVSALRPVLRLKTAATYRGLSSIYARHHMNPGPATIRDHLDGEVLLACGTYLTVLRRFIYDREPQRDLLLARLVDDLTAHLKQALDLFALIGQASHGFDPSIGRVQSISEHPHHVTRDWTFIIELLRDGLQALARQNRDAAINLVNRWRGYPYPAFRRLALFAYTAIPNLGLDAGVNLLVADDNLWSGEVMPENMNLLATLWSRVGEAQRSVLLEAALMGPDRPHDTAEEQERIDRAVWRVLSRLASIGSPELSDRATSRLAQLESAYSWRRSADNREDFAVRSEMRWGFETDISADQMLTMPVEELVAKLIEPDNAA